MKLGCQYIVELNVDNYIDGMPLDHNSMEIMIKAAIADLLKHAGWAGVTTTCAMVSYETDYPILPGDEQ